MENIKERWLEHLATLRDEDRDSLKHWKHPSQSYPFSKEAIVVFKEFRQKYINLSYVISIEMSMYQGRIAFTVETNKKISSFKLEKDLPFFYKGFLIKPAFFPFKKQTKSIVKENVV